MLNLSRDLCQVQVQFLVLVKVLCKSKGRAQDKAPDRFQDRDRDQDLCKFKVQVLSLELGKVRLISNK